MVNRTVYCIFGLFCRSVDICEWSESEVVSTCAVCVHSCENNCPHSDHWSGNLCFGHG